MLVSHVHLASVSFQHISRCQCIIQVIHSLHLTSPDLSCVARPISLVVSVYLRGARHPVAAAQPFFFLRFLAFSSMPDSTADLDCLIRHQTAVLCASFHQLQCSSYSLRAHCRGCWTVSFLLVGLVPVGAVLPQRLLLVRPYQEIRVASCSPAQPPHFVVALCHLRSKDVLAAD